MHRSLFAGACLAVAASNACAQSAELRTTPATEDRYTRIAFVSEGPGSIVLHGPVNGRYIRLVVHEPRLAGEPPSLRIETLTHGANFCCRRLERARDVELADLASSSLGPFDPSRAQFEFGLWLGESAFEFTYGGKTLWMSELHQDQVRVRPGKKKR